MATKSKQFTYCPQCNSKGIDFELLRLKIEQVYAEITELKNLISCPATASSSKAIRVTRSQSTLKVNTLGQSSPSSHKSTGARNNRAGNSSPLTPNSVAAAGSINKFHSSPSTTGTANLPMSELNANVSTAVTPINTNSTASVAASASTASPAATVAKNIPVAPAVNLSTSSVVDTILADALVGDDNVQIERSGAGFAELNPWLAANDKRSRKHQRTIIGTSNKAVDGMNLKVIDHFKWLHLSSFKPTTTVQSVLDYVSAAFGVNSSSLICNKLVKAGSDESSLRHVNFKLGVPEDMLPAFLNSECWLKGLRVRLFKFHPKNELGKKSVTVEA